MARDKGGARRRGDNSDNKIKETATDKDTKHSEKDRKAVDKNTMVSWWSRIFYPYRVLLLFSLLICVLQILVGISFFNSSESPSSRSKPSDTKPTPIKPAVLSQPQVAAISAKDLSFPCNVTGKEAVSAINRATTSKCKQEIVDLVCSLERGSVYPTSLPRSCPGQVNPDSVGRYLGCFQDSFSKRLLQGHLVKLKTDNSPHLCRDVCTKSGFSYAGVQYGQECFCGNSKPQPTSALGHTKCSMSCPGTRDMTCGGYLAMEVYETGLIPLVPSKLGSTSPAAPHPPVKIVYLLTVAGRSSRQVYRLVRQVYSPHHYVLVHVDSRQEFMYRELEELAKKLPNLRMIKNRFSTIWGGASLLAMLLSAMQELVEMEDWIDWDFVLNLSESDYPVKTQAELVTFLSNNRGNNFVKGHGREQDKFIKKQGLDKTFHECDTHMWRLGPRTLPLGVQIDGGSDWVCLNRQFVTYVVQSQEELLVGLKKVFTYTLLPAESFFHTVLRNSKFCMTYIDNNLHLTNWKRKQGCKCQYKAIVDWCGCSPNDFLPEDWAKLEATKPRQLFFARKFEPIVHQGILNKVEEWTNDIIIEETNSKHSYWQNIYDSADTKPAVDISSLSSLVKEETNHLAALGGVNLELISLEKVTTYTYKDKYEGTLVYFKTKNVDTDEYLHFEMKLKYRPHLAMAAGIKTRLAHLAVGTQFDPKELIFRNYLHLLGQNTKPGVAITFLEGATETVQFGWFDPSLALVATSKIQLNETSGVECVVPSVTTPLVPGVWTVVAVNKEMEREVARENFLVVPTENSGDGSGSNSGITDEVLEKFVEEERNSQVNNKIRNEKETSMKMKEFFDILDRCGDNKAFNLVAKCSESVWSTKYPDPKSQILGTDPETGHII